MRFRTLIPVLAVALGVGLGACQRDEAELEVETELTPADTMDLMAPPPAPMDTMMMGDTVHQM